MLGHIHCLQRWIGRRRHPSNASCTPNTTFQLYIVYIVYTVEVTALADDISNEIERA